MATFNNNSTFFNETTVNFEELGKIYPMSSGNIPFYRFKYKGKMLKRKDFKFLFDHLEIKWKQVTKLDDYNIFEERMDAIQCEQKYEDELSISLISEDTL